MNRPSTIGGRTRVVALLLGLALVLGLLPFAPRPAAAAGATFVVDRATDQADPNLGDDRCDVSFADGAQCTLRAAIEQANATPGADIIAFKIPGPGVHTIQPASALPNMPTVTEQVTIDGYTQPGSSPNTAAVGTNAVLRIQLDGRGSEIDGLRIAAPNTVVKGLVINRFVDNGIEVSGATATGVKLVGCFLGTNAAGIVARPNGSGVIVDSDGGSTTTIGGTTKAQRNLIAGNESGGVLVTGAGAATVIQGNLIGTDRSGAAPLGNGQEGVDISGAPNVTVGGTTAEAANVIAFNDEAGVIISGDAPGNRLLRNSIFANGGLGIDLRGGIENAAGATQNDALDADDGPNRLQNTPLIKTATTAGSTTTIRGRLVSTPNAAFDVRFDANPSGNEGKRFVGLSSVTADGGGLATFAFTPAQPIPVGQFVTATATDAATGGTSEFSPARRATAA